jgi:glucosamine--fructose-6-phosphate aminotransferase (isomerizing)
VKYILYKSILYSMCGICGFIGDSNAFLQIFKGLEQLQNRGYDSAGISVIDQGEIKTHKYASTDKSSALNKLSEFQKVYQDSQVGIGHTRWATHGAKTDTNSHPHVSYNGLFSLVHNGIIENFQEIKAFLLEHDIHMVSQTDTEVIVNLIAHYFEESNDVVMAMKQATGQLTGTWGISVLYKNEPHKMYCTRHGSPLLVGVDGANAMVTSEQSGFCNQFSKYIVLNNHDICVLTQNVETKQIDVKTNDRYSAKNALNVNGALTPDPYPHWTIKEINEQIDSSLRAISLGGRLLSNNQVKLGGLYERKQELLELENIIVLGCGTSYHAGMIGVQYLKELGDFNSVQLFDGAEFCAADIPKQGKTGLILLSQSGETKDLHRCIEIAHVRDLFMIGVVNVVDSLIAREVHCGCYLNAGREVAVASTKAYTSQVIILSMIAIWFAQVKDIHGLKRDRMLKDLRSLYNDIGTTIQSTEKQIREDIVPFFEGKQSCFLLGKGKCESIAREGALKIKEISYIHAEGYSTSSLKHGPFALLEPEFPVVLIAPEDEHYAKSMNAYEEIRSRHATVIMITDKVGCDKPNCVIIPFNRTYRELLSIIPLQLLSYELSLSRGLNPDMPRNLAKVVTVE